MADKKLIRIIKKGGIISWNEWRIVNPNAKISLRGADFTKADLRGADFTKADLRGADFTKADLRGADFTKADLTRVDLSGQNLTGVNLTGVNLTGVNLTGTNLSKADLSGVNLTGVDLTGVNLTGVDLTGVNLTGVNLTGVNLTGVNLTEVNLRGTNLTEADLTGVNLRGTDFSGYNLTGVNFTGANFTGANLTGANLTGANLTEVNLIGANLRGANLRGANLTEANLTGFDLTGFDLTGFDLTGACLEKVNFSEVKALRTNFNSATLTGACIQDWNINSETNLDNVICKYIYLKRDQQERRPFDPKRNFEPGEFTKLFQKAIQTVDLVFREGVDWSATAYSIKKTQILNQDTPLDIQGIEKKGDGVVVIKVNVPQDADKGKIEGDFWQGYEFAQKTLKQQYEARILDKDKHINHLFYSLNKAQEKLRKVRKLRAEQPKFQQTFTGPVTGLAQNVEGNQIINASEEKQTLAKAAQEIQNLLKQLEQDNPTASETEKIDYINNETSKGFKKRVVAALMNGGETAIEEFLDNPYLNIGKAVVKGWMNPEG